MNELVPEDLEADSTVSVEGLTYTVRVTCDGDGYRAHLSWQHLDGEQLSPPFSNPRSAMIEGQSMAEELILAWRLRL